MCLTPKNNETTRMVATFTEASSEKGKIEISFFNQGSSLKNSGCTMAMAKGKIEATDSRSNNVCKNNNTTNREPLVSL
jgi:hypothetical protein